VILVDTNVLLDVFEDDPVWSDWSLQQLQAARLRGPLAFNSIIYTELSMAFERIEELDRAVSLAELDELPIPKEALFLAGKVFLRYRRQGGPKSGVLPDFFIGAHAAVAGMPLLTRDQRRFRTYFPTIELLGVH
jgi:predicted nucleic acid-binding protein